MAIPYPIKRLVPAVILAVYSTLVAYGFMLLERNNVNNANDRNETEAEKCGSIPPTNMWISIFFVGTVFTTIGYGNVFPCTKGGQILTIVYAITSIPIALITLDNIGYLLARFFSWIFSKLCFFTKTHSCRRSNKTNPEKPLKSDIKPEDRPLPVSIGFILLFLWIVFMVIFFYYLEHEWDLTETVYFVFMTITTVGFGDISPSEDRMHVVVFKLSMIMIGLAMFSMCINLVLDSMAQFARDIAEEIIKEHFESINNETGHFKEQDPEKVRKKIKDIMAKSPSGFFIRFFILRPTMDDLVKQYMLQRCVKPAFTQVEEEDFENLRKVQEQQYEETTSEQEDTKSRASLNSEVLTEQVYGEHEPSVEVPDPVKPKSSEKNSRGGILGIFSRSRKEDRD